MNRKHLKFIVATVVIILTIAYLSFSGYQESKAYFVTLPELYASKDSAYDKRVKVAGEVVPGSIRRQGRNIDFAISQTDEKTKQIRTLKVQYTGSDRPPDTFVDGAKAIVEGKLGQDDVFIATSMTTECAARESHC